MFKILKSYINHGYSAGNIVKNWKEITLKYVTLVISAALKKQHFKNLGLDLFVRACMLYCSFELDASVPEMAFHIVRRITRSSSV
jgi:hypothetical protein